MAVQLTFFGYPQVSRDGHPVQIGLRKALALLAYLAVTARAHGRDALAEMLWPEAPPGDGRARLRRTLYRLQQMLGDDVLEISADAIALSADVLAASDVTLYRSYNESCRRPDVGAREERACLARAADLYTDDFLAGFSMRDCETFEDWQFLVAEDLRQSLGRVLERLARLSAAAGEYDAAIEHARRWVSLDRLHEPAYQLLIRLLGMAGKPAAAQRQYQLCRQHLAEELGTEPQAETLAAAQAAARGEVLTAERPTDSAPPTPVAYVRSGDVHIAYRVYGDGPVTLVSMPGFISHLDIYWEQPELAAFMGEIGRLARVVCFDKRGMGLSDRVAYAPTLEHTAADLIAVLDAEGIPDAVLLGVSEGGPAAVACATSYPQRVKGLILYGTLARALRSDDYPWGFPVTDFDTWVEELVGAWGGPAYIERFAPSWADDAERRNWWANALRMAASPGAVRRVFEALRDMDVRSLLPQVQCPTMVIHRAGDQAVLVGQGRFLADNIPGARWVELPGNDHWWWIDGEDVIAPIASFLRQLDGGFLAGAEGAETA